MVALSPSELLMNGSYVRAVIETYTNIMGSWFWLIIAVTVVLASYMKSQNVIFPILMSILIFFGFVTYGLFPMNFEWIMYFIFVLGGAILLFSLFYKKSA